MSDRTAPRCALITGVAGQDGVYLARLLGEEGLRVVGTVRPGTSSSPRRRAYLGHVEVVEHDVRDSHGWKQHLDRYQPDEIYNLAAMSSVGRGWEDSDLAAEVNTHAVDGLLAAVRSLRDRTGRDVGIFHASSAAVLDVDGGGPYAAAKLAAQGLVAMYRESHGLNACSGILGNHESPLRTPEFVTRKITLAAAEIAAGRRESLRLGNLDVRRDWGFAGEYVEAMRRMVRSAEPVDLEIGTGITHALTEVVETAFDAAGIDDPWSYVIARSDPLATPGRVDHLDRPGPRRAPPGMEGDGRHAGAHRRHGARRRSARSHRCRRAQRLPHRAVQRRRWCAVRNMLSPCRGIMVIHTPPSLARIPPLQKVML